MKVETLNPNQSGGCVIALGFFDSIHIGHRALIASAAFRAERLQAASAVFTFCNGVDTKENSQNGMVYPYAERVEILRALGVGRLVTEKFTPEVRDTSAEAFLDGLFRAVEIQAVVCGKDYTFGAEKRGNVAKLRCYCAARGVALDVEPDVDLYGEKVSTTRIKRALSEGDAETAEILLGAPFRLTGEVIHGRGQGRNFGYPTCNQLLPADKFLPRLGVYGSTVSIDGVVYRALTNLGARPTFGLASVSAETFVVGFEGDLYGKILTVELRKYLRGVLRFDSPAALYEQLETDKKWK